MHRYTVEGVGRIYSDGQNDWPSVSTVLDQLPEPEALKRWKERTDDPEAINRYKRNRGTLIHYDCISRLIPDDPVTGDPVKELWGKDERSSVQVLEDTGEFERCERDREWVREDAWPIIERVLDFDPVIDVEAFTVNQSVGYAGQFDLLFEHDGDTVLGDIKTGKYVYDKNPLQLAAYAKAAPIAVDRAVVIRINPDRQDWYLSFDDEWDKDIDEYYAKFCDLRDEIGDVTEAVRDEVESGSGMREGEDASDDDRAGGQQG